MLSRGARPRSLGLNAAPSPVIGFGTYPHAGDDSRLTALTALQAGYRLLDTALRYENEASVGRAVRECGVPREEIVVTSKIPAATTGTAIQPTST